MKTAIGLVLALVLGSAHADTKAAKVAGYTKLANTTRAEKAVYNKAIDAFAFHRKRAGSFQTVVLERSGGGRNAPQRTVTAHFASVPLPHSLKGVAFVTVKHGAGEMIVPVISPLR